MRKAVGVENRLLLILSRKVRRMRIEERVPESIKQKLGYNNDSRLKKKRCKKKHHEQLTRHDIEELMGVNRPTYKRVRGAIRRK